MFGRGQDDPNQTLENVEYLLRTCVTKFPIFSGWLHYIFLAAIAAVSLHQSPDWISKRHVTRNLHYATIKRASKVGTLGDKKRVSK